MRKLFLALLLALPAFGQVTVSPFLSPAVQFLNNSGQPLAGGKVCFFAAGSTTPQTAYSDNLGTVPLSNPLILDSAGRGTIFLTAQSYKIVIAASTASSQCVPALQSADNVSWSTIGSTVASLISTGNVSIQQSAAATSGANQSSPTDCIQGNYWTGAASAADKWCWQDVLGTGSNPTSTYMLTHTGSSGTKTVNLPSLTVTGASSLASVNNVCVVDGTTHAQTDAGINACIAAISDGGKVFMPQGTYSMCNSLPVVLSKRITLEGAGRSTILQVCAGASATTDVIQIKPSASFIGNSMDGVTLRDFYISPASGTPARSGIMIDGTNAPVSNLVIDHVRVDALGSYAFNIQNAAGLTTGTPFLMTIRDSNLFGGANFTNVGDSIWITNTQFSGVRDIIVSQIGAATTDQGAHGFQMVGNNITVNGGTIIQNATQGVFAYNDVESPNASTEANSALLDLQGNASANIQNFKIYGNYLGATTGNVTDTIRVDRATATEIFNNYTVRSTGVSYRITANAIRTHIVHDREAPDSAMNSIIADLGTITTIKMIDPATNFETLGTGTGLAVASLAGTVGTAITQNQFRVNSSNGSFCGTSGSGTAACDTFMWRGGAGQWVFGTSFGATDGTHVLASTGWAENGAPAGVTGRDICYGDSAAHALECSYNNDTFAPVVRKSQTLQISGSNFTTSSATLVAVTGLTFTTPASAATKWSFRCDLIYSQATAAAANLWGVITSGTAPTQLQVAAEIFTNNTGTQVDNNALITTATSTTVATATPSAFGAIGTNADMFNAHIYGTIEAPSNASPSVFAIGVATGNVSDALTIYRGSSCWVY